MGQYLHKFATQSGFESAYFGEDYLEPWVSLTDENEAVHYNKTEYEILLGTPLTFEMVEDGSISWKKSTDISSLENTIQYSKNGGEWTSITANTTNGTSIPVSNGDIIQFKGDNLSYGGTMLWSSGTTIIYNSFGTTARFKIKGNIMSLINSSNFSTLDTLQNTYTFCNLFKGCSLLIDASKLILPATTLSDSCYREMFKDCINLTTAPELPATTLAANCYRAMFFITEGSFGSLTKSPELPVTTLAQGCYYLMFGQQALTTSPKLPATTLSIDCYNRMFKGCTNLIQAPELLATTLVDNCYYYMFYDCTSLNYIKCLATDISAYNCTWSWTRNVAQSGTFIKSPSVTDWTTGTSGIPTNWTVQDVS